MAHSFVFDNWSVISKSIFPFISFTFSGSRGKWWPGFPSSDLKCVLPNADFSLNATEIFPMIHSSTRGWIFRIVLSLSPWLLFFNPSQPPTDYSTEHTRKILIPVDWRHCHHHTHARVQNSKNVFLHLPSKLLPIDAEEITGGMGLEVKIPVHLKCLCMRLLHRGSAHDL